jgi:hypothetical protein
VQAEFVLRRNKNTNIFKLFLRLARHGCTALVIVEKNQR